MKKYDSKVKKCLMSVPVIAVVSVALPYLNILLLKWMVFSPYKFNGGIVDIVTHIIFAIYAGAVAYFRGEKMWHKFVIFAAVFLVQSAVFLLYIGIDFAIGMAAFDAADQPPR
jgi:hypothetical protein